MEIIEYINNKIEFNKSKIDFVNEKIDGRVCISDHLHVLLGLKSYMSENCKVYAETGTLWGGSICILLELDDDFKTHYIGIDLFDGYYGENVKKGVYNNCSIDINSDNHLEFTNNNIKKFNYKKNKVTLIKGSSYNIDTVNSVSMITDFIDLFFIDGDHSENGVLEDFFKYKDFISKGGFILFDNYNDPKWPGVKKGVDKIDFKKYNFEVIYSFGDGKSCGILLIQKKI